MASTEPAARREEVVAMGVVALALLHAGAIARVEAMVGSHRGPSVLQPYRDLAKLLRKGQVISAGASWVFRGAPFVAFACYLTVSAIVPIITSQPLPLAFLADLIGGAFALALAGFAISLGGLDTASPLGGLGAARASWIGSLAEPALILVFFTVGAVSASDNPAGAPGPVHYETEATPLFTRYLYRPVVRAVEWLADLVRTIQSGDVNLYLLYVFLAILAAYLVAAL
ncbi:MAG: NADH-quinone oxidoreductase subunit H [Actinomycetes bacterium]